MAPVITPDFSEPPKLPPGDYRARIMSCKPEVSQNNVPYLNWKFETISQNPATHRRWVFMSTTFNGRGAELLRALVKAAHDPSYESGPIETNFLMNKEVMITVERVRDKRGVENPYPQVMDIRPVEDAFDSYEGPVT